MTQAPELTDATSSNADVDPADAMQELLRGQRDSFLREGPPSAAVRRHRIDRLVDLLANNVDEISAALSADFGTRPDVINQLSEVAGILPDIAIIRARLDKWMRTRQVRGTALLGMSTSVDPIPKGVVGIIGPWNFPVGLLAQPAAAAFAAGNRVMLKPSDMTPNTADVLARLVAERFDTDELAVVTGGLEAGVAFSKLRFDHLFFTGSPGVGAIIAAEAGRNLVPVTLELGGKNPAFVGHDAELKTAAARIAAARLANGGQLCLCPDEVYVPRERLDEFVELALTEWRRIAPSLVGNPDLVSIINERNFDRVNSLVDDALAKGAKAHQHLPPGETLPDRPTRRIAPTMLTGVTDAMDVAHDEVFGPVLTVHPYDTITQVLDRLALRPTPLAAYWFGPTDKEYDEFRRRSVSGGVTVNDFAAHCAVPGVSFGGLGRSGSGAYHGKTGFDTFSHLRAVTHTRTPLGFGQLITPPYSPLMKKGVRGYIRRAGKKARKRVAREISHD